MKRKLSKALLKAKDPKKKKKQKKHNFVKTKRDNNSICTPKWLKDWIAETYKVEFDFDPCPIDRILEDGNEIDGLAPDTEWGKHNFVNPPFVSENGKCNGIKGFVKKALQEQKKGKSSYFLFPFSFTKYFYELIHPNLYSIILIPQGFVKFEKEKDTYSAPFYKTLCIVEFQGNPPNYDDDILKSEKLEMKRPDGKEKTVLKLTKCIKI
jgi:hypothetical protein